MRSVIFSQRPEDGSGVTEFGSSYKRVLDLLDPGDLTLGQVVIKRVAVVELGVNNGSGDGRGCFGIEVWTVYSEADGCGNSKIWRQMRSGRKK